MVLRAPSPSRSRYIIVEEFLGHAEVVPTFSSVVLSPVVREVGLEPGAQHRSRHIGGDEIGWIKAAANLRTVQPTYSELIVVLDEEESKPPDQATAEQASRAGDPPAQVTTAGTEGVSRTSKSDHRLGDPGRRIKGRSHCPTLRKPGVPMRQTCAARVRSLAAAVMQRVRGGPAAMRPRDQRSLGK